MAAKPTSSEDGFTLVEVLAALAIFSVSILGLISSIGHATRTATEIELRTLAGIVAENRIAVFRSKCTNTVTARANDTGFPSIGAGADCFREGITRAESTVLDQNFDYLLQRNETPDPRIKELVVSVSHEDQIILTRRTYFRTPRVTVVSPAP